MHLRKLSILNFKNYEEAKLELDAFTNVFVGKNGSGKTNLLDAVYFLALTKSALSASDVQCIRRGESFAMIKGEFEIEGAAIEIATSVQPGSRKVFRHDGQDYGKVSDHIGRIPLVMVAPDDIVLIKEGGEARRKFFDGILCQIDKRYLESFIQYTYALKNRNSLLKLFAESGRTDFLALESYDRILSSAGSYIYARRSGFINEFQGSFVNHYSALSGADETVHLGYESQVHRTELEVGLKEARQKDVLLQRTSFGVHKDEYSFLLEDDEIRRHGSQGQQKSFLIALKLAQYDVLKQTKGFEPILLLDDIFDKLDDTRIERMLSELNLGEGQLLITDARPHRTMELLPKLKRPVKLFTVENGRIMPQA